MPVFTLNQIESVRADALKRAGASDEQAAIVAEEIMDAEAMGIPRSEKGLTAVLLVIVNA